MEAYSQIEVEGGHNCLVGEGVPVDSFWYLDGEFGFWDRYLFGSLAMELPNLEGDFGIVVFGLDRLDGVLGSSTVYWHSWEQCSGSW